MQWDRSNTIGLATETCKYCEGNGTRVVYKTKASPCNCVFRAIFRACLSRFRDCNATETAFGTVSWEFCAGPGGRRVYSRKQEEYMADFCLVSSLHDGMNLVSKEFVASRTDGDGVLVLSDFAGASRELTDAVVVNPFDEEQVAEAIRAALEMEPYERRRRMQKLRAVVAEGNIYRWIGKILSTVLKFELPATEQVARTPMGAR